MTSDTKRALIVIALFLTVVCLVILAFNTSGVSSILCVFGAIVLGLFALAGIEST